MTASPTVEVVKGADADRLGSAWDALARRGAALPTGLDATASFTWFDALRTAFDGASQAQLIVLRNTAGEVSGLLPLAADASEPGGLIEPSVIHGGRNGFLLAEPSVEHLNALLRGVERGFGAWRSMRLVLVAGSASEDLLRRTCARYGWRTTAVDIETSPYFALRDSAAAFDVTVSKSLKQTMRTATNKLKTMGSLQLREIGSPEDTAWAIDCILDIDRASWKHAAGTAITCRPEQERFYRALLPRAARAGTLSAHVALLQGRPVAFNFGLVYASVFSCLKLSQTLEHEALSPGLLLMADMLAKLRARGVTAFDFMGRIEPYKLRWSDSNGTYLRREVRIYPPTLAGYLAFGKQATRHAVRLWRDRDRTAKVPEDPKRP